MTDLYLVDLDMEHRAAIIEETDDVAALLHLYQVDKLVEASKHNTTSDVDEQNAALYKALLNTDNAVDGKAAVNDDVVLVDNSLERVMRQYQAESRCEVTRFDLKDVSELLSTDYEVDGYKTRVTALEELRSLLEVDEEVNKFSEYRQSHDDISHDQVMSLYNIDQEIENMQYKQQLQSTKNTVCITADDTNLSSLMTDLYLVDLDMEHRAAIIEETDDVAALLHLYQVDKLVEASKHNTTSDVDEQNAALYKALLNTDNAVDGKAAVNDDVVLVDNSLERVMRQYQAESRCEVTRFDLKDVSELLSTDYEVDGYKTRVTALEELRSLLEVDEEVNKYSKKSEGHDRESKDLIAVMELHEMDVLIDGGRCRALPVEKDDVNLKELLLTDMIVDKASDANIERVQFTDPVLKDSMKQQSREAIERSNQCIDEVTEKLLQNDLDIEQMGHEEIIIPGPGGRVPKRSIFSQKEKMQHR